MEGKGWVGGRGVGGWLHSFCLLRGADCAPSRAVGACMSRLCAFVFRDNLMCPPWRHLLSTMGLQLEKWKTNMEELSRPEYMLSPEFLQREVPIISLPPRVRTRHSPSLRCSFVPHPLGLVPAPPPPRLLFASQGSRILRVRCPSPRRPFGIACIGCCNAGSPPPPRLLLEPHDAARGPTHLSDRPQVPFAYPAGPSYPGARQPSAGTVQLAPWPVRVRVAGAYVPSRS